MLDVTPNLAKSRQNYARNLKFGTWYTHMCSFRNYTQGRVERGGVGGCNIPPTHTHKHTHTQTHFFEICQYFDKMCY